MGCFFDCFRIRNDPNRPRPVPESSPPPPPPPPPPNATEHVAEKIHLSSLFTAEEKKGVVIEQENLVPPVARLDVDESLLEEVQLLKACGTLPQTPIEIRKAVKFSDQVDKSDMKMPVIALQSEPETPAAIPIDEALLEIFESATSKSPETPPEENHKVGFVAENSEKSHVQVPSSVMKASPYATPRKITDDMQTPGTVYATSMKSLTQGNGRIRSQYVYTTLNPIGSLSQLEDLKEEHSETTSPVVGSSQKLVNNETLGDATLSSWLKPPPAYGDGQHQEENIRKPNGRNIPTDRPIIGLVATHWNEQEKTPHVAPKWFDGNGIPNSTTKYKEDQKVRWHATPFEERLEKALSEETCVPQRKSISSGAPITFEELEGQEDSATSQLKTAPKPVESF